MREILITFLIFGLVVLLAATRSRQTPPATATNRAASTGDRAPTTSPPVAETGVQTAGENRIAAGADTTSAQAVPLVAPFLVEPDVDLPLAASLPLQEAIHPETIEADTILDLVPNSSIVEATTDSDTQKATDRDYQTVLEEIAELGEGHPATTIVALRRYAHHSNPMVRATAAMTLGELAAKTQGQPQGEMVALLNELLQDSHSEVQLQASTALGKMQPPVDLT